MPTHNPRMRAVVLPLRRKAHATHPPGAGSRPRPARQARTAAREGSTPPGRRRADTARAMWPLGNDESNGKPEAEVDDSLDLRFLAGASSWVDVEIVRAAQGVSDTVDGADETHHERIGRVLVEATRLAHPPPMSPGLREVRRHPVQKLDRTGPDVKSATRTRQWGRGPSKPPLASQRRKAPGAHG